MTDERATEDAAEARSVGLAGEPAAGGPFVDSVFAALADWRRRELVQYFRDTDADTATIEELALFVAAYEPDGTGGGSRPHDDLVEELTEEHVPRLAETGVVDFDRRSGTVSYCGQPTVEKWLDHVRAVDRRENDEA